MTAVSIGPRAWNLPAAGITGSCALPDMGAGRYTQFLCKSSAHSELPSPACLSLASPLFSTSLVIFFTNLPLNHQMSIQYAKPLTLSHFIP